MLIPNELTGAEGKILTDDSGHEYLVPVNEAEAFEDLVDRASEDEDLWDDFDRKYSRYRIGCALSRFVFKLVREE